jgi:Bacterial TniB protein
MATELSPDELLAALTKELDELRKRPQRNAVGEPEFRWLADPPALPVVQAYVQQQKPMDGPRSPARPVFCAAVPQPPSNYRSAWLLKSLLQQWGDPAWDKREPELEKMNRLEHALRAASVELAILTDIHYLVLPNGRPLTDMFDFLVSFFQSCMKTVPLVIVGDRVKTDRLICSNSRFIGRFWRIRLPGEPEEPEDPEAEARLRSLLGLDKIAE